MTGGPPVAIDPDELDAVLFDMDGVVTRTAEVHAEAWKDLFDAYLRRRAERGDEGFREFTREDYLAHVDGKPRLEGVRSFLASRGIQLPEGDPDDRPGTETVIGLGNEKNAAFLARVEQGVRPYESTVALIRSLRDHGLGVALFTSSRNGRTVLDAAGLLELFDAIVDGTDAAELDLDGKPEPAVLLEAAHRLDVPPDRAAVIEDARSGVAAGAKGGFRLVIGVDRGRQRGELLTAGAHVVVDDLEEVRVTTDDASPRATLAQLPSALDRFDELRERIGGRSVALFLDYDGTLTSIVDDPAAATLPEATRSLIGELAEHIPVSVVSGRDLDDVRGMVGVGGIAYAGSHGFDLLMPDGQRQGRAEDHLPALDRAEEELAHALDGIAGARVERKRYAIAVHDRQVADDRLDAVADAVDRVAAGHEDLRVTGGKRIHELRPAIDWDKGRALLWFLETLDLDRDDVVPMYLGDDITDEDAFAVLGDRGIAVVVRGEDDDRPTAADFSIADPDGTRRFLERLLAACR